MKGILPASASDADPDPVVIPSPSLSLAALVPDPGDSVGAQDHRQWQGPAIGRQRQRQDQRQDQRPDRRPEPKPGPEPGTPLLVTLSTSTPQGGAH